MCAPHPTTNPTRQAKPTRPGSGSEPEPPRLHPPAATPASGREPHSPARRRAHCPRARSSSVHRPHATGARRQVVPRARARAPRPAPNGAIRERHAAPCLLAPTPRGGGPRGFHSVTNCFVPWGSPSRAPPFCPPLPAGRDRQHACAWSAHGILFSVVCTGCRRGCTARALPHWARTFRAPAGAPSVGLGLLPLGHGRASNPGAAHYI